MKIQGEDADGTKSVPEDGAEKLTAVKGTITVTVTDAPTGGAPTIPGIDLTKSGEEYTGQVEFDGKSTLTITATAGEGDAKQTATLAVVVVAAADKDADKDSPVAETEIGVWDTVFAYGVGGVILLLIFGTLLTAGILLARIGLPFVGTVLDDGETMDGGWAERARLVVSVFAAAGGLAITLIGAWLAALEARGRLKQRMPIETVQRTSLNHVDAVGVIAGPMPGGTVQELTEGVGKAAADVVKELRTTRGTIATICAGAGIVALAVLVGGWNAGATPAPEPTPTTTTQLPSDEPSDDATAPPADETPEPTPSQ